MGSVALSGDAGIRGAGGVEDLKAALFLMVDTALFDAGFRADLLKRSPIWTKAWMGCWCTETTFRR